MTDEPESVFEKAHAPTDDERGALELLIAKLREARYPEGLDSWPSDAIAHAVLAAGFRRSQAPEPSVLPTFFAPKPGSTTNRLQSPRSMCADGCRHRCPECRFGLGKHLKCDPLCEIADREARKHDVIY